MKICILTPRFLFPENGGDVLRINNITRYLKKKGHELILLSFYDKDIESKYMKECNDLFDKVYLVKRKRISSLLGAISFFIRRKPLQCGYYYYSKMKNKFKDIIKQENPDLFISHLLRMTPYLEYFHLEKKSIIEMTDALSKTYNLASSTKEISLKKLVYTFEKKLILNYENKVIEKFPKVILVSDGDINYLGNKSNLYCFTNGINCISYSCKYNKNKIVFVGNMRTLQNQDAVLYFVNEIYPLIKNKEKDVEFHIVGAEPPEKIRQLTKSDKSIVVTGFVDSVEKYIMDAAILVAPVRIAAGIQNKVLIGMACKVPVVMTALISKAIPELINDENCIIVDESKFFATKCLELLNNKTLRNKIAENGYKIVNDFYSWDKVLNGYEDI